MEVNHLSLDKAKSFSGFVTLFCYWVRFVIFTQIFLFSSVNNLSTTYPDTFPHLIIRVCSKNQNGTVTFMNFGCLSNDDGEGKENVLSYQMNARFFFNFFAFISYQVLGTTPNFGLKEETEFVPVLTSSKQRRKRKFTVVFVQVVKKSALDVQNLFFIYLLGSLPSS